jgi:hypothetical protein
MNTRATATLQRKCECGQHTSGAEQCAECKKKTLQRKEISAGGPVVAPPIVHDVLRSPGQPLDQATRDFMEPRFGQDFSGVRVHTDARAAESARAVNALAYTVGSNVAFGANQYAPQSEDGSRLLVHELAHVVQQGRGSKTRHPLPGQILVGAADDRSEHEAEAAIRNVANRDASPGLLGASGLRLQRASMEGSAGSAGKEVSGPDSDRALQPGGPKLDARKNIMYSEAMDILGLFDATLDRDKCLLTIQKKIFFDFVDTPPPNTRFGPPSGYSPWPKDGQMQRSFQAKFIREAKDRWSSKYLLIPGGPCASETCKAVKVAVELIPVAKDEQHTIVHVGNRTAQSPLPEMGVQPLGNEAHMVASEVDPAVNSRGLTQVAAEHEFGHMVGLPHSNAVNCHSGKNADKCYGEPGSAEERDIMGAGSEVSAKDYAPFAYALEQFSPCKWQVQKPGESKGVLGDIWDFFTKNPLGRGLALGAIGAGVGALLGGGIGAAVGGGIGLAAGLISGLF